MGISACSCAQFPNIICYLNAVTELCLTAFHAHNQAAKFSFSFYIIVLLRSCIMAQVLANLYHLPHISLIQPVRITIGQIGERSLRKICYGML